MLLAWLLAIYMLAEETALPGKQLGVRLLSDLVLQTFSPLFQYPVPVTDHLF
jgi:hypothetical protein